MPLDTTSVLMIAMMVVLGLVGVAVSVGRIGRGGTHAIGGVLSLVMMGGMFVVLIIVWLTFQNVSNSIGTNSDPNVPSQYHQPFPYSTVPTFGTPSGPGSIGP